MSTEIVDLTDAQLQARRSVKWDLPPTDVLPAWVAETDFALAPAVHQALVAAVRDEVVGYPAPDAGTGVPEALAEFAATRWRWDVDPRRTLLVGDVMAGVRLVLETLCDDAAVVVPTPCYPPFLDVVPLTGRELVQVALDPDAEVASLDLDRMDAAFAAGARTLLLTSPHNPWGRAFTRTELEALRDVALRHGARVIADEIHAPLVLDGADFVPYQSLEGTAEHAVTVLSASKAWNVPGLKCAQLVSGTAPDARRLAQVPPVANHGVSPLGIVANRAAYAEGGAWLEALLRRLESNRDLLAKLLAEQLPDVRMRPLEATYLAWLDARAYAVDRPAEVALARGRVMVNEGSTFGDGGAGHVRVNVATSPERLAEVVRRLRTAWVSPHAVS